MQNSERQINIFSKIRSLTPVIYIFSAISAGKITIKNSVSLNYHQGYLGAYTSSKAHDGDYDTWYSIKDGEVAGNFLKLYLSQTYSIWEVIIVSRLGSEFDERILNTEVRLHLTEGGETEVASCGIITGTLRLGFISLKRKITN